MTAARGSQSLIEAAVALVIAALGGAVYAHARLFPAGEPSIPGPGFAPTVLGGVLCAFGLTIAAMALIRPPADPATGALGADAAKPLLAITMLGGAALLLEPLGFMLTGVMFLTGGFRLLGGIGLVRALPGAAIATAALWLFFTKLLGVGLPYGLIAEVLFR